MTDNELKALVANLAIESEKTTQQMRETDRYIKNMSKDTDRRFQEMSKEADRRFQEMSKEADRQRQATDQQRQKADQRRQEMLKEADQQRQAASKKADQQRQEASKEAERERQETNKIMQETSRKLASIGKMIGGISKNQGDIAEEFFFHSLAKDNHLGAIKFDDISLNLTKRRGQLEEEYDLFLTNGDAIGIVEVKYKLHENDLKKLDRKLKNFKLLYPIYQGYTLYGAIASFHINVDAKEAALNKGYFVLQRSGDVIQTESRQVLTF